MINCKQYSFSNDMFSGFVMKTHNLTTFISGLVEKSFFYDLCLILTRKREDIAKALNFL